jgi:hypothetical protein
MAEVNVLPPYFIYHSMNTQNVSYKILWDMMPSSGIETTAFNPKPGSRMFSVFGCDSYQVDCTTEVQM